MECACSTLHAARNTPALAKLHATIELICTVVDFAAASLFIAGNILFLTPSAMTPALWCFLIGSVCFAFKPTLRLIRHCRYLKLDKIDAPTRAERHG
ncbi:YrhK family protein [Arthrobacter sp. LAPM80]|uniref:YrhK family protein n=1 Tax=Arthrobacter sp. LAPM80 TaxID=3141788 RepID=UPI00398B7BD8